MPTMLDFGKLALYVYQDKAVNKSYLKNYIKSSICATSCLQQNLADGIYEVILDEQIQSQHAIYHAFYASLFVTFKHQKPKAAIIAIRGTEVSILADDWVDVKSWWLSVFDNNATVKLPTAFVAKATNCYGKVEKFVYGQLKLPRNNLYITGHSLGGAIAALLPCYQESDILAITFNAPGIAGIPSVHNNQKNIINLRACYDFVSALDYPIGGSWNVFVPQKASQAEMAFKIAWQHEKHGWERLDIIKDLIEGQDFLESMPAQHSMLNLFCALSESSSYHKLANSNYTNLLVDKKMDLSNAHFFQRLLRT